MYPDIRIEAAHAKVIMSDHLDVEGFSIVGATTICKRCGGKCQDEHSHYA